MFRTILARSSSAAAAAAMRPMSTRAIVGVRRLAAPSPRVSVAAALPRTSSAAATWQCQAVRCYASAGGLARSDVYDRIKTLLEGFDKVRLL